MKHLITLVIIYIIFTACHSKKMSQSVVDNAPLNKTYWKLTKVEGYTEDVAALQKEAYVRFNADSARFSGTAGCNRLTGTFISTGNSIKIGPIAATKMMCPQQFMALEDAFTKALTKVDGYTIAGKKLQLKGGENVLAEFVAMSN